MLSGETAYKYAAPYCRRVGFERRLLHKRNSRRYCCGANAAPPVEPYRSIVIHGRIEITPKCAHCTVMGQSMKRLNLGSGTDIREGWINLDRSALPGVDVVHDVEELPLPFPSDSFDYVLCQDVLEHVDYIPLLRDIWRILRIGGTLHIRVPHFTSSYAYGDPTHKQILQFRHVLFFLWQKIIDRTTSTFPLPEWTLCGSISDPGRICL